MDDIIHEVENQFTLKHLLIFNVIMFLVIKLVVPLSVSQVADISSGLTPFNSRDIILETNKAREAASLPDLAANAKLDLAAYNKMQDMITNGYFAHTSPAGVTPWHWITAAGYKYHYAGENLALGFDSAASTVQAWLNSPTHRANVLNNNYTEIGVATALANINGINGVLVVQSFGQQFVSIVKPKPTVVKKIIKPTAQISQEVSTDPAVPTAQPVVQPKANQAYYALLSNNLNRGYAAYMVILILALMGQGIIGGFRRRTLVAMATSMALLVLTFAVPASQFISRTWLF